MKKLLFFVLLCASVLSARAQLQLNKSIQLTGTGMDARYYGIDTVASASDAVSAKALQQGELIYGLSSGSFGSYGVSLLPAVTTLSPGMIINFKANHANPGAATLDVNGLGAVSILKNYTSNLDANDIKGGQMVTVIYDGSVFQMQSQLGNSSGGGGGGGTTIDCLSSFNTDMVVRGNGSGTWECTDDMEINSTGYVAINASASSSYRLRVNGNVGIGTSPSSSYDLSVDGDARFDNIGINTNPSTSYKLYTSGNIRFSSLSSQSQSSSYYPLVVNTSGDVKRSSTAYTSSRKFKNDIDDLKFDKDKFLQLRPVSYTYKKAFGGNEDIGLIAEEVYELVPSLVQMGPRRTIIDEDGNWLTDENGDEILDETKLEPDGVHYEKIPVYLISIVAEQEETIRRQRAELDALKNEVAGLRAAFNQMKQDSGVRSASLK